LSLTGRRCGMRATPTRSSLAPTADPLPWQPVRARARRAGPRRHTRRYTASPRPVRVSAAQAGDLSVPNLWAGTGRHRLAPPDRRAGRHDRPPHRRRCPTSRLLTPRIPLTGRGSLAVIGDANAGVPIGVPRRWPSEDNRMVRPRSQQVRWSTLGLVLGISPVRPSRGAG